ncbi:MAG TPA: helix-turn-helix transcriptional regulator [Rhizomicrobium sp.]
MTNSLSLPPPSRIVLLGRAVLSRNGSARGRSSAKLEEAHLFIARHLSDYKLNPERIARALCISVRQLHLCFEPTGESLGQYIRRRRLEECRAMLESPMTVQRSVMEIAFACGFSSMPTFYRAFHHAYGAAPLAIHTAAMARLVGPNGDQ